MNISDFILISDIKFNNDGVVSDDFFNDGGRSFSKKIEKNAESKSKNQIQIEKESKQG